MAERGHNNRAPRSASVRANRRLLALSGALGGIIGLTMAILVLRGHDPDGPAAFSSLLNAPLPAWFAIVAALVWGLAVPVISWRWERVVDEHEREAYRDGAVAGFYALGIGAPVWWLLWRGGMAPPVDAVALYALVLTVTGLVWLWRKYA